MVDTQSRHGRMRHRTMAEYALEQLRESIILGELPAGTPLRLDELARSLGMSISPIREAVRQLEALGLAKHVPHQGARVLDFDIEELRDLFGVRLTLESLAVRRAAERFTEADAEAARAQLSRFDQAAMAHDVRETMRAHTDFHFTLYEASQQEWLVALIRPAWDRSERFRPALLASKWGPQERHREFDEALLTACAGHDPEAAAAALHGHLELASMIFERELGGRGIFDPH
jgi:DNA-binding GntR family transcriptional regulator